MLAVFSRASKRVLNILGQDSFLRGVACGKVNVEHGVQLTGQYEDATFVRDIGTILVEFLPRPGDALDHADGTYTLGEQIESNGATKRFVLLPRSA
jgi:hypothetical protein